MCGKGMLLSLSNHNHMTEATERGVMSIAFQTFALLFHPLLGLDNRSSQTSISQVYDFLDIYVNSLISSSTSCEAHCSPYSQVGIFTSYFLCFQTVSHILPSPPFSHADVEYSPSFSELSHTRIVNRIDLNESSER